MSEAFRARLGSIRWRAAETAPKTDAGFFVGLLYHRRWRSEEILRENPAKVRCCVLEGGRLVLDERTEGKAGLAMAGRLSHRGIHFL